MQAQENENCERIERGSKSMEEKDCEVENEKERSYLALAIGATLTEEEPQSHQKRKSSFKEIKRQGSIAVNASIQKLFGEKERSCNY